MSRTEAVRLLTERCCELIYVTYCERSRSDQPGVYCFWGIEAWHGPRLASQRGNTVQEAYDAVLAEMNRWNAAPDGDEDRIARGNYG